ncbi:hypothetical protein [Melittangium boletus]|uniref:Uncharacterized protein n=1 Tax=Melittangium boletus DSM 14713 TaxID=1294270 RepID=A0A250I6Z5_9BACT|nr:hypothetical protein [Melittangium boletus]ATB27639.1 hypothetical protein MEBOL_001083 [Melittangium boletus DSM 14713]
MTSPTIPSLPRSLAELRERARALEAEPADIDALLVAMAQPAALDEDVRARADVLHRIIDDPVLGGLRGADRRRVDETAVHALLALGEPYASELSAEGRKLLRDAPSRNAMGKEANGLPTTADGEWSWSYLLGMLAVTWSFVEILYLAIELDTKLATAKGVTQLLFAALSAGLTLFAPGLLLKQRHPPGPVSQATFVTLTLLVLIAQGLFGFFLAVFVPSNEWTTTDSGRVALMLLAGVLIRLLVVCGLIAREHSSEPEQPE